MTRKIIVSAILVSLLIVGASALTLTPRDVAPTVDGRVSQGEYPNFQSVDGIDFGASLSKEGILTLAVRAPTSGWVAVGLGSGFMDGSWILMAYDYNGKKAFSEQLGISHFHRAVKDTKILAKAVGHAGGMTTLEFQVKASDFVQNGQLPVILAYASAANFTSYHEMHSSLMLEF